MIFKGIYKYTPGDNYVDGSDKKNVLEHLEIVDECSIMAVLYEAVDSEGKEVILTGHDIASSEYRVAVAVLEDGGAKLSGLLLSCHSIIWTENLMICLNHINWQLYVPQVKMVQLFKGACK